MARTNRCQYTDTDINVTPASACQYTDTDLNATQEECDNDSRHMTFSLLHYNAIWLITVRYVILAAKTAQTQCLGWVMRMTAIESIRRMLRKRTNCDSCSFFDKIISLSVCGMFSNGFLVLFFSA